MNLFNKTKLSVISASLLLGMGTNSFAGQAPGTTSGIVFATQPQVIAVDENGNIDADYNTSITLSEASAGELSGTLTVTASSGVANFTGLKYKATQDQESFTLKASDSNITDANSSSIISDVIATKLSFTTQPSPLSAANATTNNLSTVPVVKAIDADGLVDTGYSTSIVLSENGTGTAAMSGTGDT
ncbi:hypothetical protein, partial [Poseidonibacter sp.]|uniref:hypothetical protein n=1 Tax=Poseidonibacter sp. TaxID=2321188 RepID=UPI003C71C250